MRLIVDTNLLVRVARVDDEPEQALIARDLLESATAVIVSTATLCEYDWVVRKRYKRPRAEVLASLQAIVTNPRTVVDVEAVALGLAFLDAGGDFADGVIAYDGRRLGGDVFASFDARAKRIAAAAGFDVVPGPNAAAAG